MIRDPIDMQNSNIWEEAAKLKAKDPKALTTQKVMIVVGAPSSGKTAFIKTLRSDMDFQTKPTNLMEYTFIKRAGTRKQIINCYQIATKSLTQIISTLISKDNFQDVTLVLCLDLSRPGELIQQALDWIKILRAQVDKFVHEKLINKQDKFLELRANLIQQFQRNEDKDQINTMPLHTVIIGTKYDQFQKYDTENRKWLSRTLRYIAHVNNASLYFCSTKNMQVGAQLRAYFYQKLHGEKKSKSASQVDHTKPIFTTNGDDSIKSMSLPTSGSLNTIEILKKQIVSLFPAEDEKKKENLDLSKYQQTRIDSIIAQKRKEVQKIAKMLQNAENRNSKKV